MERLAKPAPNDLADTTQKFVAKRILLVEDEEGTIIVVRTILESLLGQEEIDIAKDGHEAIRKALQINPDLILMDLSIPKLNGWEVTKSLRSNQDFMDVPILALTAHAMVGDREKAIKAGCTDYYAKPIEVDEFIAFMRPYLTDR